MVFRVFLFGPPASGKSTLIQLASEQGWSAFDIETMGKTRAERQGNALEHFQQHDSGVVLYGAADFLREKLPQNSICVLLLPPRWLYGIRLALRDVRHPGKMMQGSWVTYQRFVDSSPTFPITLSDAAEPEETLSQLVVELKRYVQW